MHKVSCRLADYAPLEQAAGKAWAMEDPVGYTQWVKGTRLRTWPLEGFLLAAKFVLPRTRSKTIKVQKFTPSPVPKTPKAAQCLADAVSVVK